MRNTLCSLLALVALGCGREPPAGPAPVPRPSEVDPLRAPKAPLSDSREAPAERVTWSAREEHDSGTLCLTSSNRPYQSAREVARRPGKPLDVSANGVLYVMVETSPSEGDCPRNKKHTCTVERDGEDLRISSHATYEIPSGPVPCAEGGFPLTALCKLPRLQKGSYTLHWAEKTMTLTVPSKLDVPCMP